MTVILLSGLAADEPTWADPANLSCEPARMPSEPDWFGECDARSDERQARAEHRARYRSEME